MIYTFQQINGTMKIAFFANSKVEAISELHTWYGDGASKFSLISFVPAENFNLIYR